MPRIETGTLVKIALPHPNSDYSRVVGYVVGFIRGGIDGDRYLVNKEKKDSHLYRGYTNEEYPAHWCHPVTE